MNFISIASPSLSCSVRTAVEHGLAHDGSLYFPESIPTLSEGFYKSLNQLSREEVASEVLFPFFSDGLSKAVFQGLVEKWCRIPTPLIYFDDRIVVELFHGPTLAFKDFGAQWMALLLGEYQQMEDKEIHILVATSGDTGGAVAAAFHKVEGIRVTILYPEGRVSEQQELQMKGFGDNIHVRSIDGSFDVCQSLVKHAFNDQDLRKQIRLSSANSINIARWIPQSVYYFFTYKECSNFPKDVIFVVPCGNLGNLSAGLMAQSMGLPVSQWIASTNENDGFLTYLQKGELDPRVAKVTLASAMDVAVPNNLERIKFIQCSTWNNQQVNIFGLKTTDLQIRECIKTTFNQTGYLLDPHTSTAWHACSSWLENNMYTTPKPILIATAHPQKFITSINNILKDEPITGRNRVLNSEEKNYNHMYDSLRSHLIHPA